MNLNSKSIVHLSRCYFCKLLIVIFNFSLLDIVYTFIYAHVFDIGIIVCYQLWIAETVCLTSVTLVL
jgi:hypothetical protein